MKHVFLKYVATINRYTTATVEDISYIKQVNTYNVDDPEYKRENRNIYITYERLIELQPAAMKEGYLFTF